MEREQDDSYAKQKVVVDLPWDIISIIITKLPVRSLARFRSVSKTWNDFIHGPSFRKSYSNNPSSSPCFILSKRKGFSDFYLVDKQKLGWKKTVQMPTKRNRKIVSTSTCNGLLCMTDLFEVGDRTNRRCEIYIYNPTTRERVKLPEMDVVFPYYGKVMVNFGYDAKANKYKVVVIMDCSLYSYECYIITVGEKSWRKIEFPWTIHRGVWGVFLPAFSNGEFFWIVGFMNKKVLVMDISDEKFRVIELECKMHDLRHPSRYEYNLLPHGECVTLVVTITTETGKRMVVWKLVNSTQGVWTCENTLNKIFKEEVDLICAVGDDRLLLKLSTPNDPSPSSFVVYNPKTGKVSSLLSPREDPEICCVFSFSPTLVSLES